MKAETEKDQNQTGIDIPVQTDSSEAEVAETTPPNDAESKAQTAAQAETTADADKAEEQAAQQQEGPQPPSTEDLLAQAQKRADENFDRYMRLNAEFDNFKKRMARENSDRLKYYNMDFIKELLPSVDSLEHAIEHGKKDNAEIKGLLEGIEMVYKLIQDTFSKFGVSQISAKGETFDPNCHQAVGTVESTEVEENKVVDEFQKGYYLHERIVRPAMVRVSKKA